MDSMNYVFEGNNNEGVDELLEFNLSNMLQKSWEVDVESSWIGRDPKTSFNLVSEQEQQTTEEARITNFEFGAIPFLHVFDFNNNNNNSGRKSKANSELEGPLVRLMKKARTTNENNFNCQQPLICQVEDCSRDLSSSKDYYRRHRLCVEHSKASKVVFDGIEQRFCQQCSRFHLLSEFDDDKRSCRKSLAGHNERRRKPHRGPKFNSTTSQTIPFLLPESLSSNYFYQEKHNMENSKMTLKLDENNIINGSSSIKHVNNPKMEWDFSKKIGVTYEMDQICNIIDLEGNEVDDNFSYDEESGNTIDLQELSAHLQRVEHQRNSSQLIEDNIFCCTFY